VQQNDGRPLAANANMDGRAIHRDVLRVELGGKWFHLRDDGKASGCEQARGKKKANHEIDSRRGEAWMIEAPRWNGAEARVVRE
jgi:hypothetical protein